MKYLKLFEDFNSLNENKYTEKAVQIYSGTLDKEKLAKVRELKTMLNTDLREGDIYTKSQFEDYKGFDKTLDELRDLLDELNIYDIYYCYDTDEVTTSEPEGEDAEGFTWYQIDSSDVKKALVGLVAEYL